MTTKPSASVVKVEGDAVASSPWVVSDELWELVEPLLPRRERRSRYRVGSVFLIGRRCAGSCLCSTPAAPGRICPRGLGSGRGSRVGVGSMSGSGPACESCTSVLLTRLRAAGEIEWSRAIVDSSQIQAKRGDSERARAQSMGPCGLQAPPPHRRARDTAGLDVDRRQPQRRHPTASAARPCARRRGSAGRPRCRPEELSPTAATTTTSTAACSGRGDQARDRSPQHRARFQMADTDGSSTTISWLHQMKRLLVRYERRAEIHEAFSRARLLPDLLPTPHQLISETSS